MLTRERAPLHERSNPVSGVTPHGTRGTNLADQLHELLALPEAALEHAMTERIRREDEMDDDARHRATAERLHAWLELDSEEARIISRAFERACGRLDDEVQDRRIETERAVILNGMSLRDFQALVPFINWLRYPPFDDELFVRPQSAARSPLQTSRRSPSDE